MKHARKSLNLIFQTTILSETHFFTISVLIWSEWCGKITKFII